MSIIHFLNGGRGDCSIIEHDSGRVSVIDVCNARRLSPRGEALAGAARRLVNLGGGGHFNQHRYPVNPIEYLHSRSIRGPIFRFFLTHPDMDHMDGIREFLEEFPSFNFYDTANITWKSFSRSGGGYREDDWRYYQALRSGRLPGAPKRLVLYSGLDAGPLRTMNWNGSPGGDGIHVLAPTRSLVARAHQCDDFNDCSYVILVRTGPYRILFAGDSHDKTWEHILANHLFDVLNLDVLIAPHHGRDSNRSYDFLDVLRPRVTLFGNADRDDMALAQWSRRNLSYITNDDAGTIILDANEHGLFYYVTHQPYAAAVNPAGYRYSPFYDAYYCGILSLPWSVPHFLPMSA